MMRTVFFYFLFIVLLIAESAIIYIDQVEISGHEGKCYNKNGKIFYSRGEIIKNEDTECVQRKCMGYFEEIGKLRIEILTCPAVEAGFGCAVKQDLSKPYPECCPQLVSLSSIQPKFCEPQTREQ